MSAKAVILIINLAAFFNLHLAWFASCFCRILGLFVHLRVLLCVLLIKLFRQCSLSRCFHFTVLIFWLLISCDWMRPSCVRAGPILLVRVLEIGKFIGYKMRIILFNAFSSYDPSWVDYGRCFFLFSPIIKITFCYFFFFFLSFTGCDQLQWRCYVT